MWFDPFRFCQGRLCPQWGATSDDNVGRNVILTYSDLRGSGLKEFVNNHFQWVAWAVLALGMVLILLWAARDVALSAGQMLTLAAITVLFAGLCVWIIGWESQEND